MSSSPAPSWRLIPTLRREWWPGRLYSPGTPTWNTGLRTTVGFSASWTSRTSSSSTTSVAQSPSPSMIISPLRFEWDSKSPPTDLIPWYQFVLTLLQFRLLEHSRSDTMISICIYFVRWMTLHFLTNKLDAITDRTRPALSESSHNSGTCQFQREENK